MVKRQEDLWMGSGRSVECTMWCGAKEWEGYWGKWMENERDAWEGEGWLHRCGEWWGKKMLDLV
ncbi:hypothetical protein [Bartonella schoenbuchensis]|uniref:hypothetical protein n=1 Tax=Bartonella schoenbuchensis TaxID=165694 RepID=UPI003144FE85